MRPAVIAKGGLICGNRFGLTGLAGGRGALDRIAPRISDAKGRVSQQGTSGCLLLESDQPQVFEPPRVLVWDVVMG